jgi:DNA-binding Xre family transcriptional regulator
MNQTEFKKLFAKNLRRVMAEREKSQLDVSKALGVSQPTVSTWMTAKKVPKMETVDALCAYLHCRRSDLLEEHNAAPLEDARRELVRLAMTAELENVKTALILLSALEQKNAPHG